jgi:biopolymer transport protein ExbD
MRSLSRTSYRPAPVMNVTPLVDVVLVLLIIFMVVIPAMEKSAQVDLPSIFNVDPEAKSKTDPFTLSLTTDGSIYLEQDLLAPDAFLNKLREANEREPSRRLVLRADRAAHYGEVFPGVSLRVNELKGTKE